MLAGSKWDLVNSWIIILQETPSDMQVKDPLSKKNNKIDQYVNMKCEKDQRDVFFSEKISLYGAEPTKTVHIAHDYSLTLRRVYLGFYGISLRHSVLLCSANSVYPM